MTVLETKNLKKYYGQGESLVKALDGVNLKVEQGEFVSIVGTSGSGKSTLLHMLGGLDYPTQGSVVVDGKDISGLKEDALAIFRRRKIGFVFQSYNLVPVLNVYENIVFPVQLDGNEVDISYVDKIIKTLGIEGKVNALPSQLSGGQQQRVAIARARDVLGLLKVTAKKFEQTIVMITHNEEIAQMANRIVRIEDGRIVTGGDRA